MECRKIMKKELSNTKQQQESSPWTKRFIAAAIIQGAIIVAQKKIMA
jgi:hypothetical protein